MMGVGFLQLKKWRSKRKRMAGKLAAIEIGSVFGRLTLIERAGCDAYRHPLVRCKCECGQETVCRLSKLNAADNQRTRSCGCLKKERYLTYMETRAKKLTDNDLRAIFIARCGGVTAEELATIFHIDKDLVDAAVRLRQEQLRSHWDIDNVKRCLFGNMAYERIATLCHLQLVEVAWIAKQYRAELSQVRKDWDACEQRDRWTHEAIDMSFTHLIVVKQKMERERRTTFRGVEWSESKTWKRSKDSKTFHVMVAYGFLDVLPFHATTPERKAALHWFLETIEETKKVRKLRRSNYVVQHEPGFSFEDFTYFFQPESHAMISQYVQ